MKHLKSTVVSLLVLILLFSVSCTQSIPKSEVEYALDDIKGYPSALEETAHQLEDSVSEIQHIIKVYYENILTDEEIEGYFSYLQDIRASLYLDLDQLMHQIEGLDDAIRNAYP